MRRGLLLFACLAFSLHAQDIARVQQQLLQVRVKEELDPNVPVAARALILQMKSTLSAKTDSLLVQNDSRDAVALGKAIKASLPSQQVGALPERGDGPNPSIYGGSISVEVRTLSPNLLLVEESFNISCGQDTLLLAYKYTGTGWKRALRWQAGEYAEVKDAFGDAFDVMALQSSQGLRLAVLHGHPWCTSVWSGFDIDVLDATADADRPHVVWYTSLGYVRDDDKALVFRKTVDGFEVRPIKGTVDTDVLRKRGVYRYRIDGNVVHRVQPVALNGRDFVDEWLQRPWVEAKEWTDASVVASLEKVHAQVDPHREGGESLSYGPVRACAMANRYQVEIDRDKSGPLFFEVEQGANRFMLMGISRKSDSSCSGKDLMGRAR